MGNRHSPAFSGSVCRLGAALFALLSLAGWAAAQGPQPADMRPNVTDPKAALRERQARESMLRNTEMLTRRAEERRASPEAAAQVVQDFREIQVLRNNIARHLKDGGRLDFEFIAAEAREVNRRAGRLRANLMPPPAAPPAEKPKSPPDYSGEQLRDVLAILLRRIDSFTENPMFKVLGVVDVAHSARAGGDLQTIIQLSDRIKEGAERLHKSPK